MALPPLAHAALPTSTDYIRKQQHQGTHRPPPRGARRCREGQAAALAVFSNDAAAIERCVLCFIRGCTSV